MNRQKTPEKSPFYIDFTLLGILIAFMIVSLVAIYNASEYVYFSTISHVKKQLMWYVIGFSAMIGLWKLGQETLYKIIRLVYLGLLFALFLLVFIKYMPFLKNIGFIRSIIHPVNGAWAWFHLPGLGSFQPSEFMKITLVFITAQICYRHNAEKTRASYTSDIQLFLKVGAWVLPALFLNILQPDTGIPLIIIFSLIIMMYTAATQKGWFIAFGVGLLVLYFGVIYVYRNHPDLLAKLFGGSYRLDRFYGWLDYEKYSQLSGYQLNNSLINLGVGGSYGIGDIALRLHTSEGQTDFIFSIIGSKFGFVGSLGVIALCIALNTKLMLIAINTKDMKAKYAISGLIGIFMIQQIINISMMVGILPITGITLPLISYGGSSLASYLIALSYPFMVSSDSKQNPIYESSDLPKKYLE